MCGIVGVVGNAAAAEVVLTGLARLEYRGYDSAGIAVLDAQGMMHVRKAVGKLAMLQAEVAASPLPASTNVIGHTRWATHGAPSVVNAHPHAGQVAQIQLAVVHNGIIENYADLRAELACDNVQLVSDTDTETLPFTLAMQMVDEQESLSQALLSVRKSLRGNYAFVVQQAGHLNTLVATRKGAPLCVGLGHAGANYVASDPLALAGACERFIFLHDDDVVELTPTSVTIWDTHGSVVKRPAQVLDLSAEAQGKQGFKHFMLKEICEQPDVVSRLLQAFVAPDTHTVNLPLGDADWRNVIQLNLIGCGTAFYAACVGKYALESLAGLPVNVDVASEFRYRNPPFVKGGVFVAISQSGETADTLAALEHAKATGQHVLVLTNSPNSSMARAAHAVVPLQAGREIAVASTKAMMAMLVSLTLLALQVGKARGTLTEAQVTAHVQDLRRLPTHVTALVQPDAPLNTQLSELAERLGAVHSMLYLGRGWLAPLAAEGALKLKELAYIHAEGYASGEMKHGPIALVDRALPVLNLAASNDGLFEKTLSNLKEVEARHGQVILLTDEAGAALLDDATRTRLTLLTLPNVPALLLPMVFVVPMQMLAYLTATAKGTDVDQPRNLAKSVTVE